MSDGTQIQWTDASWNPTTGCTKVSPGCAHCYIDTTPAFRIAKRKFEKGNIPIILHENRLQQPLHWAKPRRIFVNSLSDLFHEDVPGDYIAEVYGTMVAAYWHEFQVLTKRPARRHALLKDEAFREAVMRAAARHVNSLRGEDRIRTTGGYSRSYVGTVNMAAWEESHARNIWEGVTVENQRFADERIPILLETPAAVRFLSCEPLLGPVDFKPAFQKVYSGGGVDSFIAGHTRHPRIDWVIVGGESGPKARPMDLGWAQSIVRQCQAAGVAVFVKQLGAKPCVGEVETAAGSNEFVPDLVGLNHRKGADPSEWPSDLQFRQFPEVRRER